MTYEKSAWCGFDIRVSLCVAVSWAIVIACVNTLPALSLALLISICLVLASKSSLSALGHTLRHVNLFVLFLWVFTPFCTQGPPLLTLGYFTITSTGLTLSLAVTLKVNAIACVVVGLLDKVQLSQLGQALEALRIPQKFVFLIIFTAHALQILRQEWLHLTQAAKLRGFVAATNLHTYKTLAALIGILLIKSFEHAQRAYEALLLRGFAGHFFAPTIWQLHRQDYLLIALVFLASCGIILLQVFTN